MRTFFLAIIVAFGISRAAMADENLQAADLSDIAPFINDSTLVLMRVDLDRLDVSAAIKAWVEPLVLSDWQRKIQSAVVHRFDAWTKRLRAEGVTHFYVVASVEFLPNPELFGSRTDDFPVGVISNCTYAVVPGASWTAVEAFHQELQSQAKQTWPGANPKMWPDCRSMHGAAVVGMGTLLDALAAIKPQSRPQFGAAFAAADNAPVQLAIVPPPFFTRACEELLREPAIGSETPAGPIVARGFQWLALGADPGLDKFQGRLVIQSVDIKAAQALADLIQRGITAIAKQQGLDAGSAAFVQAAQKLSLLPEAKGDQLILTIDGARANVVRTIVQYFATEAVAERFREESKNNLKQIGLAIMTYVNKYKEFPQTAIRDKAGRPLLSWRVAILPYIEEETLYKEFHLDEPWDSGHNRALIDRMPAIYRNPDVVEPPRGRTRYLGAVGDSLAFTRDRALTTKDFTDGLSTIMVVEADAVHAVIWTTPEDIEIDLDNPARGLSVNGRPFVIMFADGAVRMIPGNVDPSVLRGVFTRNGGEKIDWSKIPNR